MPSMFKRSSTVGVTNENKYNFNSYYNRKKMQRDIVIIPVKDDSERLEIPDFSRKNSNDNEELVT